MIAHLRGILLSKTPSSCIIECAGVGYEVAISIPTYTALPEPLPPSLLASPRDIRRTLSAAPSASLPQQPSPLVAMHIYTQVREDTLALYGFLDSAEKKLFERLITVSGVGPRLALTILSGLSASQTIAAVRAQDHATLTRIPGVGKRLAERLAVELKEKLDDLATLAPSSSATNTVPDAAAGDDVLSALVNLGYNRPSAQKALETALAREPGVGEHFDTLFRAALSLIR